MQRFLSRSSGGICSKRHTEISLGQKMKENGKEAMSYLMSKDANSPLELSSPTHCTWPYSLPLRRAFWASWVMASASSKITSLKPFLGRQVVLSKSFFNLTVTSRPKLHLHICAIGPWLIKFIFPRTLAKAGICGHIKQIPHCSFNS